MAQTALFIIFVAEFVVCLIVLMTWESGYGFSSFEEHNTTRGCRKLQQARHRRRTRRQRKRCHAHRGV